MDFVYQLLVHPISNGLILGPLMGLFLSWLFMPSTNSRSQAGIQANELSLNQAITYYDQRVIHIYPKTSQNTDATPLPFIVSGAILCLLIIFLYIWHGQIAIEVIRWLLAGLVIILCLSAGIRGYVTGRFSGMAWLLTLAVPVLVALFQLWLMETAERFLLAYAGMPRPRNLVELFRFWGREQLIWILLQGLGLAASITSLVVSCLFASHYLLLADYADDARQQPWRFRWLRATGPLRGIRGVVAMVVTSIFAWFTISGMAYGYIAQFLRN